MTKYHLFMCANCLTVRAGPTNVIGDAHICPVCKSQQKKIDLELTVDGDPRGFLKGENWLKLQSPDETQSTNQKVNLDE